MLTQQKNARALLIGRSGLRNDQEVEHYGVLGSYEKEVEKLVA